MEALGLKHTKVHSKTFLRSSSVAMDSSVKYGLGVTTPNEMATLFELMARGRAVSPAADSAMLAILEHNVDDQMLQRFAAGTRSAHKTGATDAVRTECALFYLASRVVACVLTKENVDQRWVIDTEPQVTMARMGEAIVRAWGPAPAPKYDALSSALAVTADDRTGSAPKLSPSTQPSALPRGGTQTASFDVGDVRLELTAAPGAARLVVADG